MHVVDDDQLLSLDQHMLALAQEAGDDAGDVAAVVERGVGDLAHKSEAAAAIDKADAVLRQDAAKVPRGLGKGGIAPRARAAIDANIPDTRSERNVIHESHVAFVFDARQGKLSIDRGGRNLHDPLGFPRRQRAVTSAAWQPLSKVSRECWDDQKT